MLAASALHAGSIQADWTETARFHDGTAALMQERPPLTMDPMAPLATAQALTTDHSPSYQEILGFGGAFAEADPTSVAPASSSAAADAAPTSLPRRGAARAATRSLTTRSLCRPAATALTGRLRSIHLRTLRRPEAEAA